MPERPSRRTVSPQPFIQALIEALPLHAEEDPTREFVREADLISHVTRVQDDAAVAQLFVATVRRLFESLGLLDHSDLLNGGWSFVSFPASLLARSILETLATDGQSFVEPGYWVQAGHPQDDFIDEQRQILRLLELRRTSSHPNQAATPIRTVHVAWGLLKIDDRLPLRAREDKARHGISRYVFPGGRLRLLDLPPKDRSAVSLRELSRVDSQLANKSLANTLARELREELGLQSDEYKVTPLRILKPYTKVEGAANSHAYTVYNVAIYSVHLTRDGMLKVLDRVGSEPEVWEWFSPTDVAISKRADGATAFVDALRADLGDDVERYLLEEVPDSGTIPPAYDSENDSIDLPKQAGEPISKGASGKERPLQFSPTEREWELLMILGWHRRGLEVKVRSGAITLLGAGWLRLNDPLLVETARNMANRLKACGFPAMEVDLSHLCRLSIAPTSVYFHPERFEYHWLDQGDEKSVVLALNEIDTHWAILARSELRVRLTKSLTRNLRDTEAGKVTEGDFARECRTYFEPAKALGLRKFVSTRAGIGVEILVPHRSL